MGTAYPGAYLPVIAAGSLFTEVALPGYSPEGLRAGHLALTGPTWESDGGAEGVALCGASYTVVGAGPGRVVLLLGEYGDRLVAYHPDDTEVWYLHQSACLKAASEAARATLAGADGVRRGC